jgi:HSP20 family molecular chaperone IbpA
MMAIEEVVEVKHEGTPAKMRQTIYDELKRDLADWMTTDKDEVWRPPIELTEEGHEFAARALIPGVDAKHAKVLVAPDVLMVKGETPGHRKFLRSIKFPRPINPDGVHAEIKDGMLAVRAEIADEHLMLKAA